MNMHLNVTIVAPEFVSALNNLAGAIAGAAHARVDVPAASTTATSTAAKPAKAKLATTTQDTPSAPISPPVPTASLTLDAVKALAALKAKKVGAAVVKALIADTGSAQIADIADAHVLASLAANLEAL